MIRIQRSEYDVLKANCAAKINAQMVAYNLTPALVQKQTTEWALNQVEQYSISLADLHHYRHAVSLPRPGKLEVLAKVLKCAPDDLVPKKYQTNKIRVRRKVDVTQPGGWSAKVEPQLEHPGYAAVTISAVLETDTAYKVTQQLARLHTVGTLRRSGLSDEQIQEHLAIPPRE